MKSLKRFLLLFVAILVVAAIGAVAMFKYTFSGVAPVPEQAALDGGALLVKDGIVAAFIVPTAPGKAILIDCGEDKEAKRIKAALAEHRLEIEAIFVTHGHADHVGGCEAIGAPIYALAAEVEGLRGERDDFYRSPVSRVLGGHGLGLTVTRPLSDGESLTVGNEVVRVFALPGHSVGSAGYIVDGVLYFGDAALAGEDGSVMGPLWIFSDDVQQGKESLRALASKLHPKDVTTFAFSHSDVMPADLGKLVAVD